MLFHEATAAVAVAAAATAPATATATATAAEVPIGFYCREAGYIVYIHISLYIYIYIGVPAFWSFGYPGLLHGRTGRFFFGI